MCSLWKWGKNTSDSPILRIWPHHRGYPLTRYLLHYCAPIYHLRLMDSIPGIRLSRRRRGNRLPSCLRTERNRRTDGMKSKTSYNTTTGLSKLEEVARTFGRQIQNKPSGCFISEWLQLIDPAPSSLMMPPPCLLLSPHVGSVMGGYFCTKWAIEAMILMPESERERLLLPTTHDVVMLS